MRRVSPSTPCIKFWNTSTMSTGLFHLHFLHTHFAFSAQKWYFSLIIFTKPYRHFVPITALLCQFSQHSSSTPFTLSSPFPRLLLSNCFPLLYLFSLLSRAPSLAMTVRTQLRNLAKNAMLPLTCSSKWIGGKLRVITRCLSPHDDGVWSPHGQISKHNFA